MENEFVAYTPEGFKKAAAYLDFLPEDQREMMLSLAISFLLLG